MTSSAILSALRERGGKATLGDLMCRTGLSSGELEQAILPILSEVQGHVAVDQKGELLYYLPKRRPRRKGRRLRKALRFLYGLFQVGFFATLSVVFFAYALVYAVILAVLAIGASEGCCCDACDCCSCDCPCGSSDGKKRKKGSDGD